jgi:hypothetical protein
MYLGQPVLAIMPWCYAMVEDWNPPLPLACARMDPQAARVLGFALTRGSNQAAQALGLLR